ncbi:Protein PAL1 [Colletotrichum higginsianum]|uniref:Protein PAL1 n=1 Tax=Colletotrichum higginsianum TaxID=80884 RepID=A0A4T0VTB1_9PEZI|nr:Protein PAL1 [Colletotrichum higginsianum]
MSKAQSTQPGHQPSRSAGADLTLNLSSNNPFRNRAASPLLSGATYSNTTSPASPFDDPPPRPVSRNPFLDPSFSSSQPNLIGVGNMAPPFDTKASPTAEELFDGLTINDQKQSRPDGGRPSTNRPPGQPGRENIPPGRRGPPPPGHRPSRSQEEAMRQRRMQGGSNGGPPRPAGAPASPQRRPQERRPRRNSDSSVLIDIEKPLTEEEKKAKDARRRERERRAREGKDKDPKKPSRRLDIIDQLDATSIYGTGLFHHDGPFDAANPHRNRKGSRRAPMHAFAKDSLNMSLGGSGPLNKRPDHATFLGNNDGDASADFATAAARNAERKADPAVFDPRARGSIIYGEESMGLGASTFLEGTPAARAAIQRTQAEQAQQAASEGLGRSKSIAQRIRGIKREPREYGPSGRITNPEGAYTSRRSPDGNGPSSSISYTGERNPFFSEYGKEPETISVRRNGARSPGSPPPVPRRGSANGLERRATADATSPTDDGPSKPSGGFLARVKSLKGGRRRQVSDAMAPPPAPGTAA